MSTISTTDKTTLGLFTPSDGIRLDQSGPNWQRSKAGTILALIVQAALDLDTALVASAAGQAFKTPVQYVAVANVGRSGLTNGAVNGGVLVAAGARVLCTAETDPVNNGIWVAAAGAWARAADFDEDTEVHSGFCVPVDADDPTQPDSVWIVTSATGVVGTNAITFSRITFLTFGATIVDIGTAAVAGVSNKVAREDHVHDLSESVFRAVAAELTAALALNGQKVSGAGAPTVATDLTTKGYVDALAAKVYGTGSDGALDLDAAGANTPQGGAVWNAGTGQWEAARDIHATDILIEANTTLDMKGFFPHATGTLTLAAGAAIAQNGGDGGDGAAGAAGGAAGAAGAATPAGTLAASGVGKIGAAHNAGVGLAADAVVNSLGGTGGTGGAADGPLIGGAAGAVTDLTAAQGHLAAAPWVGPQAYVTGVTSGASAVAIKGGSGGGSGAGGDDNASTGGGGGGSGAGGGTLLLAVRKLVGDATAEIQAKGGAGGAGGVGVAAADSGGGGAGGGGGVILILTDDSTGWAGTMVVAKGAIGLGGAASGGGGVAGSNAADDATAGTAHILTIATA